MKVRAYFSIGYNLVRTDILEIPDEEIHGLSEDEKNKLIDEYVHEWANNYIDFGYTEIEV